MAPLKKTRSHYTKSTRGCQTCKTRRVKCDETRPYCHRCVSTGRRCDGPRPLHVIEFQQEQSCQRKISPSQVWRQPTSQPWLKRPEERRAFFIYLQRAAPVLSGALDVNVWNGLVPQLAETDIVVRFSIFAISHLFEHPIRSQAEGKVSIHPITRKHLAAMSWHAQALFADRMQDHDLQRKGILLRCMLLSSLEFQQNNFQAGLQLIRVGYRLLAPLMTAGCYGRSAEQSDYVTDTILPLFMRNTCLLLTSSNDLSIQMPSEFEVEDFELVVFHALCIVNAGLKDVYLARKSRAQMQLDQLIHKQIQTKTFIRTLEDCLHRFVPLSEEYHRKIQALQEYCEIGIEWLDKIIYTARHRSLSDAGFLMRIVEHIKTIKAQASACYPIASSTTFFHQMVFSSPSYLIAIFAPNAALRSQALGILKQDLTEIPNTQLHAIVTSLEPETINTSEPVPPTSSFQIYQGHTDQVSCMDKVYDTRCRSTTTDWQPNAKREPVPVAAMQSHGIVQEFPMRQHAHHGCGETEVTRNIAIMSNIGDASTLSFAHR